MKHSFLTVNLLALLLYFSLITGSSFAQTVMNNAWIDEGGTYTDVTFQGTVNVYTSQKVIFNNCTFRSSGNGMNIYDPAGGDVEITYSHFEGQNPNQNGSTQGKAIHAWRPANLRIENCTGTGFRGFWVQQPKQGGAIIIRYNHWTNIQGRKSNGNGGYLMQEDPNPENSQFVMITNVNGGNVEVAWNYIKNEAWNSKVEDVINFYECVGTAANPLKVSNNLIEGAYTYNPTGVKAYSGSGIQVEASSRYVHINGNYLINASNASLALSWATQCKVYDNKIVSSGYIPGTNDYICQNWRGMLIGNPFWQATQTTNNEAYNNLVWFVENFSANDCNVYGRGITEVVCLNNNNCYNNTVPSTEPTHADELAFIAEWWGKVASNNLVIGADGGVNTSPPAGGGTTGGGTTGGGTTGGGTTGGGTTGGGTTGGGTTTPVAGPAFDNANERVPAHSGSFLLGTNILKRPNWNYTQMGNLAAGNPAVAGAPGAGAQTIRIRLEEWQYDVRFDDYKQYVNQRGLKDITAILGFPKAANRDTEVHCASSSAQSILFDKLYEDIWVAGASGPEVNPNNPFANYVFKTVSMYKDYVKYWSILDSVDLNFSGKGNLQPGVNGNWWDNDPDACDLDQLRAPVYHYIRMMRIAYEVIRHVDQNAYIVLGGVRYPSFLDALLRNTDNPDGGDVTTAFPEKGGAYFDVLGMEYYPFYSPLVQPSQRHSDAAAEGLENAKQLMTQVLTGYGYEGTTYPAKLYSLSSTGVPRKSINGSIGGEEVQRNYLIKLAVKAKELGFIKAHTHLMGDLINLNVATKVSEVMGLYENLFRDTPYTQVYTSAGVIQQSLAVITKYAAHAPGQLAQLNLPQNVKGAAYLLPDGNHCFILWAETTTDNSEDASAIFTLPSNLGITQLRRCEWDYALTEIDEVIDADNIELTGAPTFFIADVPAVPVLPPLTQFGSLVVEPDYNNGLVDIKWTTTLERENDFFSIERSIDGLVFQELESVTSLGDEPTGRDYQAYDLDPIEGVLYYRIKQTSIDGTFSYSEVVELIYEPVEEGYIECYPVPIRRGDPLTVEFKLTSDINYAQIIVRSIRGRRILRRVVPVVPGVNQVDIPTGNFRAGNYYVVVNTYFERYSQLITVLE